MNKGKLTLDDVLRRLQTDQGMTPVTEMDKVKGGTVVMDGCHKPTTADVATP